MFRSDRFQLVELVVGAGVTGANSRINFQQQPQLQSLGLAGQQVYLEAIEVFSNISLPTSPLTSGNVVAAPADIVNATLTLVEDSDQERRQYIPLAMLNRTFPNATGAVVQAQQELYLMRDCFAVSWTKCYVTIVAAPVTTPPYSYIFGVHYSYNPPGVSTLQQQVAASVAPSAATVTGMVGGMYPHRR